MRIGYDAKRLYCNFTGLGNYSRSLLRNLNTYHKEMDYYLYTPKIKAAPDTQFFLDHPEYTTYVSKALFKSYWRSFSMTKQLKKDRLDLYHGLSHEIPVNIHKTAIKSIVTVHDLIFKVHPETYSPIDQFTFDLKYRNSCKRADRIIAISENTKKDLIKFYDIASDKIDVVYQSCAPLFFEESNRNVASTLFKEYNLPSVYMLSVGTVEARKNLKVVIEAYRYLSADLKLPLVIVGKGKKYKNEIKALIQELGLSNKIIWMDNLKDNHSLKALYQNAQLLVYPSFYEGFGLPVAEALLCKTPVIAAQTSSLTEAGGPNSLYIDPTDAEALAMAIKKVLLDSALRDAMKQKGFSYAIKNFSPETTANQTVNSYNKLR